MNALHDSRLLPSNYHALYAIHDHLSIPNEHYYYYHHYYHYYDYYYYYYYHYYHYY